MRCLIIDDDESPRTLMERLVTRAGHRATGCASPMAGIQAVTQAAYDVAIVDMELPGMDGAHLIGELRRVTPELRVLVVSGYGDRNHVMAAIEAGADGYILKDELSESLANTLQDVRAGNTPLSPRVAKLMVTRLRQTMNTKAVTGSGTGSNPAVPATPPAAAASPAVAIGRITGSHPALSPSKIGRASGSYPAITTPPDDDDAAGGKKKKD